MPEIITRIQKRIVDFWKELEKSQKIRIYIIAGILLVAIVVGLYLMARVTYVPLYSSNDRMELSEMKGVLDQGNFKSKISQNSLLIDSNQNDSAQAYLVQKGYPKSVDAIFSDAWSKIKLSSTSEDKRKLDKNTQERTLAAKLKLLDNIEDATVNLALPEPSAFLLDDNAAKPTASVMIKPRGELSKNQIHAVVMWVAKSVENLDPKDITVVDYNMKELTSETGDEAVDKASSQYEMKLMRQQKIEKDVMKMFDGQFDNFDNIKVVANPVLDFDILKSNSKKLANPENIGGPAVTDKETHSVDLVNGSTSGGTPGMGANPGTTGGTSYQINANGENSTYKEKTEKVHNEYDVTESQAEKATGEMVPDKSSMAINLLYGSRVTDETKITAEVDKVKAIASSATGIPVTNIAVNTFKIVPPAPVQVKITDTIKELLNTYGSFALILFLAIALMIAAVPKKKKQHAMELEPAAAAAAAASGPRFIVPDMNLDVVPEIELEERSEVKKQIDKFVKQKPDAVAQLLRNWLSDEWDM